MRPTLVALLISTVAWISGNVLLVALAKPLFAHAPGEGGGGGHEFVSHFAAGTVFGDVLSVWAAMVSVSLLPVAVIAAVLGALSALRRASRITAWVLLAAGSAAAAAHVWSVHVIAASNRLLAALLGGTAEGSQWTTFKALHREAQSAMGAETLATLVLAVTAALILARASSPPADH